MSKVIQANSSSHFRTLLSGSTFVVVDFYADWCGPCKTIAPIFKSLADSETKAGKMAFVKVDVDSQPDIAQTYSVSAMPTFLIFKNGAVTQTIRGADPSGLRNAVMAASSAAAKGPGAQGVAFGSKGAVLGSSSASSASQPRSASRPSTSQYASGSFIDTVIRFVALYFTTLFSLDAKAAAEASPYSISPQARAQRTR